MVSLRNKLIALFGEQQALQEDLDVQRPAPSQFEMNPVEQVETINQDPADEGARPDPLPPPPPEGEEKQPPASREILRLAGGCFSLARFSSVCGKHNKGCNDARLRFERDSITDQQVMQICRQ